MRTTQLHALVRRILDITYQEEIKMIKKIKEIKDAAQAYKTILKKRKK